MIRKGLVIGSALLCMSLFICVGFGGSQVKEPAEKASLPAQKSKISRSPAVPAKTTAPVAAPAPVSPAATAAGSPAVRAAAPTPLFPAAQVGAAMSRAVSQRDISPRPMNLDDSGGIRIIARAAQVNRPGDRIQIQFSMTRPVAAGMVDLKLRKMAGGEVVYQTVSIGWNPAVGEPSVVTGMTLPAAGLSSGIYYITGNHPAAWGISDSFTVQVTGEGLIRIVRPRAGEGVTPGSEMHLDYSTFGNHVPEGRITFELFKLNADGSHGSPTQTYHRQHHPGSAGTPDPIHMAQYTLPRTTPLGRYFIQATHPQATGRSATFSVTWEMEGHDLPSDYAVAAIYKQGNHVKARVRATGGDIADYVDVRVNGIVRREIIRPSTDTEILLQDLTGATTFCGYFYEVSLDPDNRLHEADRSNNNLRKWVSFRENDGYASTEDSSSSRYVGCEPPRGSASYGYTAMIVHNCSGENMGIGVEVRQVGWITPTSQLNVVVPHQTFIAPTCSAGEFASRTRGTSMPPGGCAMVRVGIDDLRRVDSVLSFEFRGDMTRWPTLHNPSMIELKFGHWSTEINTRTGQQTRTCVFR